MSLLPFGLKDGKLLDVSAVERGLACGCQCPACGGALVARQGDVNIHHFAHYGIPPCKEALKVAIRLAVKQVLEERREMLLPPAPVARLQTKHRIQIDQLECDAQLGLAPDAATIGVDFLLTVKERKLAILLRLGRGLSKQKQEQLRQRQQPTLLIDFSGLIMAYREHAEQIHLAEIAAIVVDEIRDKKWVWHTREANRLPVNWHPHHRHQHTTNHAAPTTVQIMQQIDLLHARGVYSNSLDVNEVPQLLNTAIHLRMEGKDLEHWIQTLPIDSRTWMRCLLDRLGIS